MDKLAYEDIGKLTLRLMVGILMLFHGVNKIVHSTSVEFIQQSLADFGLPSVIAYGVYFGEIIAPIMIIFGVYVRFGALIVVINMIFAIALVHGGDFFSLTEHGGWRLELQAFYLFGSLAVLFLGSGKFAVKPG